MNPDPSRKSTVDEIRARFDADVDRFSNLETGQSATVDAPLAMDLITAAAVSATRPVEHVLDIGCGAGNNTIKLLRAASAPFHCDLNDLSQPMLERAQQRVQAENPLSVELILGDFREARLPESRYDIILAAAVLHHLRTDDEWESKFQKIFTLLRPGGSFWVTDLVAHDIPAVQDLLWRRYAEYLKDLGGEAYQQKVLDYIEIEDSPRSVTYQIELMRKVGFTSVDILHKNTCFAAFGGCKPRTIISQ